MTAGKENPYKIKAYQRAAPQIRTFSDSMNSFMKRADLTAFPGNDEAIASCIREIVTTGKLGKREKLRGASPEVADISRLPRDKAPCEDPALPNN
jgi:DNA polymerase (family 10)